MTQDSSYLTLAQNIENEEVIKASRFIAYIDKVLSVEEAMARLESIRLAHPSANHHCWAYRIRGEYRFSDDGEPGGTAGKPIYEVLNRRGLERIQAIVVRYFGGIKLGAGGLVRAYSGTVAKALEQATFSEVKPHIRLSFHIPFTLMDSVHRFLADRSLAAKDIDYDAEGMFFSLELLLGLERAFELSLSDLTRGQAQLLASEQLALD
ncbi:MAG: YigZ family protein [Deinococcales bacterium]